MLTIIAHGSGAGPHQDLWSHWVSDPAVLVAAGVTGWAYVRGQPRRGRARRSHRRAFWAGFIVAVLAVASPLDALAGDLASAHMVQHLLLVVIAAPLFAYSAPAAALTGGMPTVIRPHLRRARRSLRRSALLTELRRPGVAWFLFAGTQWFWHASGPYGAALDHTAVHAVEHLTFLLTAVLFWSAVLRPQRPWQINEGYAVLLVFTMAMQGVFLAALLTFATSPWYEGYLDSTARWGLEPLADQQLAGAIMWVPAGLVYVAAGVGLIARWTRSTGGRDADWVEDCAAPAR